MLKPTFHQPTYRPLSRCGVEELAAHQRSSNPSGGVLFARKVARPEKDAARSAIGELFKPDAWPGPLSMLTMPGVAWLFERFVFSNREEDWRKVPPTRTKFTALENDRAIFHAGIMKMPGLHANGAVLRQLEANNVHERGFTNDWIDGYHFANVDDFMATTARSFDAAWLDYTGPLSIERLRLIRKFWESQVGSILIVTSMRARWNRETSDAITRAGNLSAWVRKYLRGSVVHEIEYQDGPAPMFQIAIRKDPSEP